MYPRNAASPERIGIGAVVQASDGAVQTSGVAVKVIPQGGAEASGDGTIAYSADGIVLYTPTQAETNYTSFVLVASKSGCFPVEKTIVTTAQSTAGTVNVGGYASGQTPLQPTVAGRTLDVSATGEAGVDWANIGSPTTTVALTGTTISSSQVAASVTGRVTANTDQWNGVTVTGMPMPTYTQPTGFLAATFPSVVASTTNITAASGVSLSAGSISSIQSGLATAANQNTLIDYAGYTLSVLSGAVTGAQTSSETYAIALGGSTYTVAMAGLTSTGTRTAPTLTKT